MVAIWLIALALPVVLDEFLPVEKKLRDALTQINL